MACHPPAGYEPDANDDAVSRRTVLATAAAAGAAFAASSFLIDEVFGEPATAPATTPPSGVGTVPVSLDINGKRYDLSLEPRVTLLDALREYIGLPGSKKGCDHGQCGACTVLVDGRRINPCLTLAIMNQGKQITTIEGLANGDQLHPLQSA